MKSSVERTTVYEVTGNPLFRGYIDKRATSEVIVKTTKFNDFSKRAMFHDVRGIVMMFERYSYDV